MREFKGDLEPFEKKGAYQRCKFEHLMTTREPNMIPDNGNASMDSDTEFNGVFTSE